MAGLAHEAAIFSGVPAVAAPGLEWASACHNPAVIPRNHRVAEALTAAEQGDLAVTTSLLEALADPYAERDPDDRYRQPPAPEEQVCQTFCGT